MSMKVIVVLVLGLGLVAAGSLPGEVPASRPGASAGPGALESFARSQQYEKTQSYDAAVKALLVLHRADPADYTVNLRLGWLYYLSGRHANAERHYTAAIRLAPASLEARLGGLLPLLARGRWEEAEVLARQVLEVDAANYYANLRLAYALRRQGKLEPAARVLDRMLSFYPTDVSLLTEQALVSQERGNEERAAALFGQVLRLDSENVTAREQLAALLSTAGPRDAR